MRMSAIWMVLITGLGTAACDSSPTSVKGLHVARCGPTDGASTQFVLSAAQSQCNTDGDVTADSALVVWLIAKLQVGTFMVANSPNAEAAAYHKSRASEEPIRLLGRITIDAIEGIRINGRYDLEGIPGEGSRQATFETVRCDDAGVPFAFQRCGSPFAD